MEWGGEGLVHDEDAQAFYTPSGELALSRDLVDLQRFMVMRGGSTSDKPATRARRPPPGRGGPAARKPWQ